MLWVGAYMEAVVRPMRGCMVFYVPPSCIGVSARCVHGEAIIERSELALT